MTDEKILRMAAFIEKAEGNLTHVKRVHHLIRLLAEAEHLSYDEDALAFAAYFHDLCAYPAYSPGGTFDHAEESAKRMPDLAREWGYGEGAIEIIVEAVRYHNKAGMGRFVETTLLRNADGIDYLGYMAVARDMTRHPKDMRGAMNDLKKRKAMFAPLVDLASAKALAAPRIAEMDAFIQGFEEESFGIY